MSENQPSAVNAIAAAHDAGVMMGFQNLASFEFMQRAAKLFANSTMVPAAYQAVVSKGYGQNQKWEQNPAALPNCMVALDLAQRMNASPLQVMQNLHVIEGRPSWASAFIIAQINNSGHYAHNLRFRFEWLGEMEAVYNTTEWANGEKRPVTKKVHIKNAQCVAWTKDKTGELIESPPVTVEMAVQEGWYTRTGSKWPTMTQLMCQYRAAALFGRTYNPELLMGLPTADELHDIIDVVPQADGSYAMPPAPPAAAMPDPAPEPARAVRPPRAKQDTAPAAEVAQAAPEPEAPAATPAPEPAAAPAASAEPADKPAEVAQVADKDTATLLAEPTPEPTPTPAKAPAKAEPKQTPKAGAAGAPPLTPQKIAFVKAQLDTTGGWTTDGFIAKFGITPDALAVTQFPDVLAWFKTKPTASA